MVNYSTRSSPEYYASPIPGTAGIIPLAFLMIISFFFFFLFLTAAGKLSPALAVGGSSTTTITTGTGSTSTAAAEEMMMPAVVRGRPCPWEATPGEEEEEETGAAASRRKALVVLLQEITAAQQRYISYEFLKADAVPCSRPGLPYYNCRALTKANPYSRGCLTITRCARDSGP